MSIIMQIYFFAKNAKFIFRSMTYQNITIVHPGAKTIKEYYYYINNAVEINEDKIGAVRMDSNNNSIISIINMATSQIELEINLGILRNIFPRNIDNKQVYSDCIPKDIQSNDIRESKEKRNFTYFESHDVYLEIDQQYIQIYRKRILN